MRVSRPVLVVVLVAAALVLSACAAGPNDVSNVDAPRIAGFWFGLWHGVIYPITFIVSLFTDQVNVYDVHNDGNWYDFGFVLGIAVLHTVTAAPSRVSRRRDRAERPR